jgi:hypothetical protein
MSYYEQPKIEYFSLDNTEGYTQKELDEHNTNFEQFLVDHAYDPESENGWNCIQSLASKYFNEHMC